MPRDHAADGLLSRSSISRLDVNGRETIGGRIVLLSIGGANATEEWCSESSAPPCNPLSFYGRAIADPSVNHEAVVIVNGARAGKSALDWVARTSTEYDRIRDTRLAPLGLSEKQVQVVWLQITDSAPTVSLPAREADAYLLRDRLGAVLLALKARYPNLRLVFVSSRMYGGYSQNPFLSEPYSYETGFAVKWLIESHITDKHSLNDTGGITPWVDWGPYFWTNGAKPRSDGLAWTQEDFKSDGANLSESGQSKAGQLLLDFFKRSELTSCWFLSGQVCRSP